MNSRNEPEQSLFLPSLAEVVRVEPISEKEKLFRLRMIDGHRLNHQPGQFVEVSVLGIGEAPISLSSSPSRDDSFELGIRSVGNVTRAVHRLNPGDTLGIRGPFGNGYPVSRLGTRDLLFVAGGIGIFPLRSMIQYAIDYREMFGVLTLLYGCREPAERIFKDELREWRECGDVQILESVDRCPPHQAWDGNVGVITTLFPQIDLDPERTTALVVGPPIMYRFVAAECLRRGMAENQIFFSLERKMKCGMGLCGHCQINNMYVCLDGPVFSYEQLTKLEETEA
ncbi:MAG: FAD/NAD(P)-binding protein [Thermodesulfobacteriota bacterium]